MKDIKTLVQEMINAHSCYPALKEAGQEYLDSIGRKNEIDDVLAFFQSDDGKKVFGEETALTLTKQAQEVKAKGGKYCFCPACTAGVELLERKAEIL